MPDLDSGAYTPSIGQLLYNHYKEINLCNEQYLTNKDWINDPPAWVQTASPASEQDLTKKGAKIRVNGPNDFGWRTPYDATMTTVEMIKMLREEAQTTSKAVDAILGKAMGSRTSATEAQNAFQAAMSGITTDINMINYDLMGGYATRHWLYTGTWFEPHTLEEISGQFGYAIKPEDMWLNVGLKWDVGSTFIENITKQQNIRYILESGRMDPELDRNRLWRDLLIEMGFDGDSLVNDNGRESQIQFATLQSIETYMGQKVIIDPDQDHQIAIKVKTAFLKDKESYWNITYGAMAGELIKQIEIHQQFLMLQQQQMLAQQQMAVAQAQLGVHASETAKSASLQKPAGSVNPGDAVTSGGVLNQ